MNIRHLGHNEAKLEYFGGDYKIKVQGSYVLCAVTREKILLEDLLYWNVERQEAYASCEASYQRQLECNPHLRKLLK